MQWKNVAALVLLLLVLGGAVFFLAASTRPDTLTFVATSDTQGLLVPCGCATTPSGGLARRAALLAKLSQDPAAGDVIPVELGHGFADRSPGKALLNRAMGEFFGRHGFLVGLSALDVADGGKAAREAAGSSRLFAAGREGFEGWVDYTVGGWGAGPFGEKGALLRVVFLADPAPEGGAMAPPALVFSELLAKGEADAYIVFGNLSPNSVADLVKTSPKILGIVSYWDYFMTSRPQKRNDTWLVFNGDRGRRYTTLRVARREGKWDVTAENQNLGPEMPSDPLVQAEAEKVNAEVEKINTEALEASKIPLGDAVPWRGSESCQPCHPEAYKVWAATKHARSLKSVGVDHQQQNPECLRCHTTGFGKPGGYPNEGPGLNTVGCEACHGPAGNHPSSPMVRIPLEEGECRRCHTYRDAPNFDFESAWKLMGHGKK